MKLDGIGGHMEVTHARRKEVLTYKYHFINYGNPIDTILYNPNDVTHIVSGKATIEELHTFIVMKFIYYLGVKDKNLSYYDEDSHRYIEAFMPWIQDMSFRVSSSDDLKQIMEYITYILEEYDPNDDDDEETPDDKLVNELLDMIEDKQ